MITGEKVRTILVKQFSRNTPNIRKIFAKNLKEKRKICGLSQAKLAEKVNVSTHHIAMIELMHNFPTSELIERIVEALDIEVYELFIERPDPPLNEFEKLRNEIREDMEHLFDKHFEKSK